MNARLAHIDHKHSVNIGKSVKGMGGILKMTSAFLCSSSGAICKAAVWNFLSSQQSSLTVVLSFDP